MAVLFSCFSLYASKTSVLKLCAVKDGEPFILHTDDSSKAEELGFKKFKEGELYIRNFRVLIDDVPSTYFKPFAKSDNCITIFRIDSGKKTVAIDFKSVSYTTEQTDPVSVKFKPGLLHTSSINVSKGPTATVKISQSSDRISLYQALDNKEIKGCDSECEVPVGIPIYFMIKSYDEKVDCPVKFELITSSEKEKNLNCYNRTLINKMLTDFVEKNKIMCRINVEYAFFKVFGEGCIVSLESDEEGLTYKTPEIKLLPLEKQKFRYFWQINSEEKKPYSFSGDRKGLERTPAEGDIIQLIEERNF